MSCPQFIGVSLALRTATHIAHLLSTSYAEHVALGEFYPALEGLVDQYAEVYMGGASQEVIPRLMPPTGSPKALLTRYLDQISREQADDDDNEALTNILAELQALTSQTLYKLRFLK